MEDARAGRGRTDLTVLADGYAKFMGLPSVHGSSAVALTCIAVTSTIYTYLPTIL